MFNCDESGLYYKLLPEKSLAAQFEKSADGRKTHKERVTISACSNATGSIKLPLLLIGKSKNPCCLNIPRDSLPVEYASQSNAWVNSPIFLNWFHHSFVPFVRKKLIEMGLEPKAVLLLDNCSAHPNDDELVSADGNIHGIIFSRIWPATLPISPASFPIPFFLLVLLLFFLVSFFPLFFSSPICCFSFSHSSLYFIFMISSSFSPPLSFSLLFFPFLALKSLSFLSCFTSLPRGLLNKIIITKIL